MVWKFLDLEGYLFPEHDNLLHWKTSIVKKGVCSNENLSSTENYFLHFKFILYKTKKYVEYTVSFI